MYEDFEPSLPLEQWTPSYFRWLKVNTNATFKDGKADRAFVVHRDEYGQLCMLKTKVDQATSAQEAELKAPLWSFNTVIEQQWAKGKRVKCCNSIKFCFKYILTPHSSKIIKSLPNVQLLSISFNSQKVTRFFYLKQSTIIKNYQKLSL